MRAVRELGYPVPLVHTAQGPDLVMELLDGPTLADAVLGGSMTPEEGATILAELHDRLRPTGFVHLDLHPFNVMLTSGGPVVIDWRNAGPGPADLDLAATSLVLAMVALDPGNPAAPAVDGFLRAFLDRAEGDPLSEMEDALARRTRDPNLTAAEKARLPQAAKLVARHAVRIREVRDSDLEALFAYQSEPESAEMAAVPVRDRETFFALRAKIKATPTATSRAILCGSEVAGDIGAWEQDGELLLGYRIGKQHWGRGIASRALELFKQEVTARPMRAFVAEHNAGSIRVLEKAGFVCIEGPTMGEDGIAEYLYELS